MKILYVEDNEQDAQLARLMVTRHARGSVVTTAPSVKEALDRLRADAYDVLLTDFNLPDGTGLEILRYVRERALPLPVVVITGVGDDQTALKAMRAGADDYISKRDNYLEQLPRVLELAISRQRETAVRRSHPLRVLYAEHNAYDLDLTRRHFAHHAPHIQLEIVPTSAAILARFSTPEGHKQIDVLMLDFQLPGWSALDLLKELLQVRSLDLPIIVVTGQGREELVTQSLRLGAADYVLKTGSYLDRLPITLENAWFRAQMRRQQADLSRLAAFPEHSPKPVFELTQDGRATYCNRAASALAAELGLAHPSDLLPSDTADNLRLVLETGAPISYRESTCAGRVLAWSYCPVVTQSVVHCYADDVTQRHQLEERLVQSQKMEAIGQLAGGVAHDFNNLLTVIVGNLQTLRDACKSETATHEATEEIASAAVRATALTRQLLAFGRRSAMQRVNIDLNDSVAQIAKLLARTLGELIELQVEPAPEPAVVFADPSMLEQVIMNLALNARDAMPRGGKLHFRSSLVDAPPFELEPKNSSPGARFVLLRVSDTGSGIAPETLPRIFEPFFTTKALGQGTGLGLATVQGIVQQHGGFLRVQSQLGHGSCFEVYLPALESAEITKPPTAPGPGLRGGSERILIVEDEASVRSLTCRMLSRLGYGVHVTVSGIEAIEVYKHNGPFDLMITDLIMPGGVNGLELAQRLRSEQAQLPVVFTSGYEAQVMGPDFKCGADESFLAKPYELSQLCHLVREMLDQRSATRAESKV